MSRRGIGWLVGRDGLIGWLSCLSTDRLFGLVVWWAKWLVGWVDRYVGLLTSCLGSVGSMIGWFGWLAG